MNLPDFIASFEEELQLASGSIHGDTRLRDISRFDSMGRLLFMNMIELKLGTPIAAATIDRCATIAELHAASINLAGQA